jgi:hypothetical protein
MATESKDFDFIYVPEIDLLACPFVRYAGFRNTIFSAKYRIARSHALNIFQKSKI